MNFSTVKNRTAAVALALATAGGTGLATAGAASAASYPSVVHTNIWSTTSTGRSHTTEVKTTYSKGSYFLAEIRDSWSSTGAHSHLYETKRAWPVGHYNEWRYLTSVTKTGHTTYRVTHTTH